MNRSPRATLAAVGLLAGSLAACTAGDGDALPAPPPKLTVLPEANAAPPVGIVTTTTTTLPPTTTSMPGSQTYTVATGDTLTRIANRYGTTVATLLALNRFEDPNNIAVGQRIIVPPPASTTTAPPTAGTDTAADGADDASGGDDGSGADDGGGAGAGDDGTGDGTGTVPSPTAQAPSTPTQPEVTSTASTLPAATETG